MKRGARSIRGAMGTYIWVAVVTLVLVAVVLWKGPALMAERVRVTLAPGVEGVVLTGDSGSYEIRGDASLELIVGMYDVRVFTTSGAVVEARVELAGDAVEIGPAPDPSEDSEDGG